MGNPALPLLVVLLEALAVVLAALAGGIGLLVAGEWRLLGATLAAGLAYPVVMPLLHWLRWLFDVPAILADDARWHGLAIPLAYLSGTFTCALVLGWTALACAWVAPTRPAWAALAWGWALVSAPLLSVILRPFAYPLLLAAAASAQLAYPLAWLALRAGLGQREVLAAVAALTLVLPLLNFSRRWRRLTAPD